MSARTSRIATRALTRGTHMGIEWYTAPAPMNGAINGYMRIPADHPLAHAGDYNSINDARWGEEEPLSFNGGAGELTFCVGDEDGSVIVGFDTLHYNDYWPGDPHAPEEFSTWWTLAMVEENCRRWCWWIASKAVQR